MSNVAVFEADIDTSKLIAGSQRAKKAFDEIGASGTRAFDSLQGQVEALQSRIEKLEGQITKSSQKSKASFSQLSGAITGLTTNIGLQYYSWDNLDKVQLRVTKSQRLLEEQAAKVKKMQQEGKVGTQEYAFELRQLEEMQQRVKQSQGDLNQAQFMFILSSATLATSTIPNTIRSIQSMDISLKALRTTLWTIATHPVFLAVTGFFLAWEFGISKVIEKTQGLKDGEASIVQGLQRLWEGQNKVTSDGVTGFSQYSGAVGETSAAIQGLIPTLGKVTSETGKMTNTVKSYAQALELIKSRTDEIDSSDFIGNVNDTLKKLAIKELPSKDFGNFDKFIDLRGFDILDSYNEKWKTIIKSIQLADTSTIEHQRNLHELIRLTVLPDMKEYAEVVKNANDPRLVRQFRNEIQQLAKDFKISKEQAKELLDIFDSFQKKSSDKLGRTGIEDIKAYAEDLGFSSPAEFLLSLDRNEGGDWAGLFMRRIQNMKRSGRLGSISTQELENFAISLRTQGLINQLSRAVNAWVNLIISGESRSVATAQARFLESIRNNQIVGQHGGLGIGTFGTSPAFRASVQNIGGGIQRSNPRSRVSGSARARRRGGKGGKKPITEEELLLQVFGARGSANAGTQAFFTQQAMQKYNQTLDLLTEAGLSMPSVFRYGVMRGRYVRTGINENFSTELSALVARAQEIVAENRFRNITGFSRETGRQYASQLGVSLDDITRTMSNELTYNDILAQINFQRRLASISA
jgi:uncharacterized membrane protein (DUF106 family)